MSCQRGNVTKCKRPKFMNKTAFKNNLHDTSDLIKRINELEVSSCCNRCKDVIEWKIKFNKYKPLSQPKKCVKCLQKTVKNSYYTVCLPCSEKQHICGKC
ncbi:hypothetical protein HELRODRAFT_126884, partial [Helobdella robusta]|uniref:Uncharacterized protein n=1 Tax=Helobdella robusta TaxID=6412 RepID=T1EHB5_HELRO